MKKFFNFVSVFLVAVFCLSVSFGCSCSKPMNAKININISNGTVEGEKLYDISSTVNVYTKFREPSDAACYEKIEDKYELIEDSEGIASCYDAQGNKFEKATFATGDKKLLSSSIKYHYDANENNVLVQSSNVESLPENSKYSLMFEIIIENRESFPLYFKEYSVNDIVGDILVGEAKDKVTLRNPYTSQSINEENYYVIPKKIFFVEGVDDIFDLKNYDNSIKLVIELRDLTKDDLKNELEEITLNLNISLIKFEE